MGLHSWPLLELDFGQLVSWAHFFGLWTIVLGIALFTLYSPSSIFPAGRREPKGKGKRKGAQDRMLSHTSLNSPGSGRPSPCSRCSWQKRCRQRRPQLPTVSTTQETQSHHDMKSNPFSWQKRAIRARHVIFENYQILTCPRRYCPHDFDIHGQILDLDPGSTRTGTGRAGKQL